MQTNVPTIVVAFAAGILVAGGAAYVFSDHHHEAKQQQLQQQAIAKLKEEALPNADTTPPPDTPAAAPAATANEPAPPVRRHSVKPNPTRRAGARAPEDRNAANPDRNQQTGTKASEPTTVARNDTPGTVPPMQVQAPAPSAGTATGQPASSQPLNPPADTQTAPPPARTPKTITLPQGTSVTVRLNETLSTDRNSDGDTFTASLDKAIVVDGFVIADRGARALGKVIKSERAGRVKGVSNLELALTQFHTTDEQTVAVDTTPWLRRGDTSKKRDAAEVAGGAALGAIIGAIAGGGKGAAIGAGTGGAAGGGVVLTQSGKQTTVPAETRITFTLQSPVTITERLN